MKNILTTLKLIVLTSAICCAAYPLAVLALAHAITPETAQGSLVRDAEGRIIGSRLIAQGFTQPRYFWPRPSAVDYNAAGAGGSNLSPTNPELKVRAEEILARLGQEPDVPVPADLLTASGSGLDPHISEAGARFQAARVAGARGIDVSVIQDLIAKQAFSPTGPLFGKDRIVNVLEINLALDAASRTTSSGTP